MSDGSRRFPRGLAVSGWLLTAALAAGVTLAAVSALGSGIFGGSLDTMTQDEVDRALAAATAPAEPGTASPPPPTATSPPAATADPTGSAGSDPTVVSSTGGTVIARCTGSMAEVLAWTPAQGFRTEDDERGPAREVKVEFESDDDDIRVEVRCVDGLPSAEIDDHGGED